MMLSVCSAAPSSSSHLQLPFHFASRAFYQLHKATQDGHSIEDRPFCVQDGFHVQGISFKTRATRLMHSLVLEQPEKSGSADSSILSPYPNEFDDIVHGLPNEFSDNHPENLSYSVGEGRGLYPLAGDQQYMVTSDISGPKLLDGDLGSDFTNGVSGSNVYPESPTFLDIELPSNAPPSGADFQDALDVIPRNLDQLSGSTVFVNEVTGTTNESPIELTNTLNLTNKVPINPKESIGNFLSEVTESVDTSVDRAQAALKSTYTTFVSSYADAVKSMAESFDNTVNGLFSSAGNSRGQASAEFTGLSITLKENIYKTGTLATDILRRAIIVVEDSLSSAATFLVYSYGSAKSLLPPDLKNAINVSEGKAIEILRPVGNAARQTYIIIEGFEKNLGLDPSDPIISFLLLVGGSTAVGVSYWLFTYGGYSGDLAPESTLVLLRNDKNAVLIDVRPEDLRKRDGVPDLRRAARSKYAHVTCPELDGSLRKMLKGGKGIDEALIAVVIRNLKLVKNESKVIIMDSDSGRSKAIARSLNQLGVKNAYLVEGGFKSWVRKGLPVKELKPETALTVLNEEAEAILQDIKPTPTLVIGYGLGIVAACYALSEWEKTLQVIGIIGLGQTLFRRFASYEGSEDLQQDVRLLLTPVSVGAQAVSWAAGKLEPTKIGLPTSPSSTAVQDRVLKAAAKHESQPSDADDSQGLPTEASGQPNENLDLSEA